MARRARANETLLRQINERWPRRSKASDGWIGDPAHAARVSYHNPDGNGIVWAIDITHDPVNGVDIAAFTDELVASGDDRILEIIANDLYWNYRNPRWVEYTGSNEHRKHFHLTVKPGPLGDDPRPWNLPSLGGSPTTEEELLPVSIAESINKELTGSEKPGVWPGWPLTLYHGAKVSWTVVDYLRNIGVKILSRLPVRTLSEALASKDDDIFGKVCNIETIVRNLYLDVQALKENASTDQEQR